MSNIGSNVKEIGNSFRIRKKLSNIHIIPFIFICFISIIIFGIVVNFIDENSSSNYINILSSYENQVIEDEIRDYVSSIGKKANFTYMGDLDIVNELNNHSIYYDAVWISNSMWLYMLDNSYLTSDSKSISISPIVFGIKKSKAQELGLVNNANITNTTILNLIREKKIKYVMNSVTQTNSGATAYLGFLSSLAGNPEVLTKEMLDDDNLISNMIDVFSGVERVSGDEGYLQEMFLNDSSYEAVIASEATLIDINKALKNKGEEQLYLIYPTDGVAINDSTFAFINNDREGMEETFLDIQEYLLSDKGQKILENSGQRTWYGGISDKSNSKVFDKNLGIDTTKYLNVTKFPSKDVITYALNLYIDKLRKPTHVVFCLDYSGSMEGSGVSDLKDAMNYILNYNEASIDNLQFSEKDKITVITFSSKVNNVWSTDNGHDTEQLINNIAKENPKGATNLYDATIEGLNILSKDDDTYTKTIIAMTDGEINMGSFDDLKSTYRKLKNPIPIYSIMFGQANESQLENIAKLSNAKVFNGKSGLLEAFKEVRGYN